MAQCIEEKRVRFAAIKSELHLCEISREMLCTDLVPASNDAALEQRECRLNGIGRNAKPILVSNIFFTCVVYGLVRDIADGTLVSIESVRDYHVNVSGDVVLNVLRQSGGFSIFGMKKPEIAVALTDAYHNFFSFAASETRASLAPSDIGFVHFDSTVKHGAICFFHGRTDAMAEIPRGLVADSESPLDLIRAHSLSRFTEKQSCEKPLLQRQMGVIENRAGSHGKLVIASLAVEQLLYGREFDSGHLAAWALNASGPAEPDKNLAALFVSVEQVNNVN